MSVIQKVIRADLAPPTRTRANAFAFDWKLVLACGHKLEVAREYHDPKIVARWCPTCQGIKDASDDLLPLG